MNGVLAQISHPQLEGVINRADFNKQEEILRSKSVYLTSLDITNPYRWGDAYISPQSKAKGMASSRTMVTVSLVLLILGLLVGYLTRSPEVLTLNQEVVSAKEKIASLSDQLSKLEHPHSVLVFGNNTVSLIDGRSHTLFVKIRVDYWVWPGNHYVDSQKRLWGVTYPPYNVAVIDPKTLEVVKTMEIGEHLEPLEVTPDGRLAFVPVAGLNEVWAIDTSSFEVMRKIHVGKWPTDIDMSPDGSRVYVPNRDDDTISVIDVATLEVLANIPVDEGIAPYMLTVSPDGKYVFAEGPATRSDGSATGALKSEVIIDAEANKVIKLITLPGNPIVSEFTPDGKTAFIALTDVGQVAVIDVEELEISATIPVGKNPAALDMSPDGRFAYIPNLDDGTLSIIDTQATKVITTVDVGEKPLAVVVIPQ